MFGILGVDEEISMKKIIRHFISVLATILYHLLEYLDGEKSYHHIRLIPYRDAEHIKLELLKLIEDEDELS